MINIFVIGKKGLEALNGISPEFYKKINAIIIGQDNGVVNDYSMDIKTFADARGIRNFFRMANNEAITAGAKLNIAIGWRWIIALKLPLIVFHDSILPKYRGFNPLVSALIRGDNEIGVTALVGSDEFDKGDIIAQRTINIDYPMKIERAIELLSHEYAALLSQIISEYDGKLFIGTPQNESEASFSLWRDHEDYLIDWSKDSAEIKRMIDAVGFPYTGATTFMDGQLVRIFDATELPDVSIVNRTPGKVLFRNMDGYVIVCGAGLLKVSEFYNENNEAVLLSKFRIRFK